MGSRKLGMSTGKARNILVSNILLDLITRLNLNYCYRCGGEIKTREELSIEHKEPWLGSEDEYERYFNLNNISFSHLKCNVKAARRAKKTKHPSEWSYRLGCRCKECKIEKDKTRGKRYTKPK